MAWIPDPEWRSRLAMTVGWMVGGLGVVLLFGYVSWWAALVASVVMIGAYAAFRRVRVFGLPGREARLAARAVQVQGGPDWRRPA